MTAMRGKDALVEQIAVDGHRYVFGNPGTTEQGFIEALERRDSPQYILTLHEGVAVGMADAYARVTGSAAVVQLHCSPGLGNAMGLLYDSYVGHTPLVVYVGQQARELIDHEPMLPGRPAEMARPVVKSAYEVQSAADIPVLMRRAMRLATESPRGPVCLSIPADVLDEPTDLDIKPSQPTESAVDPDNQAVARAAKMILEAKNPVIVSGDGVGISGAEAALEQLAHAIGCLIYTVLPSQSSVGTDFPLFAGNLNVVRPESITALLGDYDLVVAVGAPLFPVLHPPLPSLDSTNIIQIDADAGRIGRSYEPALALAADPRATLTAINDRIKDSAPPQWRTAVNDRRSGASDRVEAARQRFRTKLDEGANSEAISAFGLVAEVATTVPEDTLIFEDAPTFSGLIQRGIPRSEPGSLLMARGGGLGQGMPGTLGVKLARPDRPVVGIVGDGSAMYTIQSLWTAARYRIPVTYLICNNGGYRILGRNMAAYLGIEDVSAYDSFFNIDGPPPDFAGLAESYGVAGRQAKSMSELRSALRESLESDVPSLIEVQISGENGASSRSRPEVKHASSA